MLVLGIDPGTQHMGYALVSSSPQAAGPQAAAEDYGVISLPSTMPIEYRLYQLHTHILNMISIFHPAAIAVEQPFVGKGERQFIGPAIAVGQAQAVVLIGAASQGIPIFTYSPAQVKLSVANYGAATKEQMQRSVAATLGLTEVPQSDAADALSICLCHLVQQQAAEALGREIRPGSER
jgi:crossover junction endodeoxyribonuclease RuvC